MVKWRILRVNLIQRIEVFLSFNAKCIAESDTNEKWRKYFQTSREVRWTAGDLKRWTEGDWDLLLLFPTAHSIFQYCAYYAVEGIINVFCCPSTIQVYVSLYGNARDFSLKSSVSLIFLHRSVYSSCIDISFCLITFYSINNISRWISSLWSTERQIVFIMYSHYSEVVPTPSHTIPILISIATNVLLRLNNEKTRSS